MIPALALATVLAFAPAPAPSPAVQTALFPDTTDIRTEEVRFESGELTLAGVLFIPPGAPTRARS